MQERESLGTRMGFLFVAAACAIGLGNVWRFPFICGEYGGGIFVLIYLVCLIVLGLPILAMEFAIGRGSQKSIIRSFQVLEPKGTKWHIFGPFALAGNYLLMMFYTVVTGWMINYLVKYCGGAFANFRVPGANGADDPGTSVQVFLSMLDSPWQNIIFMAIAVVIGFASVALGLKKGTEMITKFMMSCLLLILVVLIFRAVTLPGAGKGLRFFLLPHTEAFERHSIWEIIHAAMGHAFFTLSVGMGSMAIFGSYIGKQRRLFGESILIGCMDTFCSIGAGLVIFSSCFAFGIIPNAGPGLVFMTLPNVFHSMPGGTFWGIIFFVFMSFAAVSTVITVFELIVSCWMDLTGWSRKKICAINLSLMLVLCLPTALGFNVWANIHPLGGETQFIDLFDFAVSNNILPIGACIFMLFCVVKKHGWGYDNFLAEVNAGKGLMFPSSPAIRGFFLYLMPIVIGVILVVGYMQFFK